MVRTRVFHRGFLPSMAALSIAGIGVAACTSEGASNEGSASEAQEVSGINPDLFLQPEGN